jgi:multicomponent Na+:H+ antiporter subunit A
LKLWHGINPVLMLSLLTVLSGIGLFFTRHRLRDLAGKLSWLASVGPTSWYERSLQMMQRIADKWTRLLQNGSLRSYIFITMIFTLLLLLWSFIGSIEFLRIIQFGNIYPYEWLIAGVILISTFVVIHSRSRLGGVVALGVIGYSIALIFVFYSAPDLAITQILVETLTVILFVFVVYHLPRFDLLSKPKNRLRDGIIAILFGAFMSLLVLKTLNVYHPALSDFFGQNSYLKAYGKNVVNVILVDFRALDTLGEITVLSAAALGVYALLKLKSRFKDSS